VIPQGASQRLWSASGDLAVACLDHPFVRSLRDGTLSGERYRGFLGQDAFFLDAFARAYACGVSRAPDRRVMRALHALQCGALEEQRLHERVAAEAGIDLGTVLPLPATRAYTDFLVATAFGDTLGELLAAMAPCMRLYRFLGEQLSAPGASAPTYRAWIDSYASAEYGNLVTTIEALLDEHATGSRRETNRYRWAMELEYRFFDAAWRTGGS
jgi:thiaminase/transcriptional activator TenA